MGVMKVCDRETTMRPALKAALTMTALLMAAGCVKLQAPDKPIEINMNLNIRHEVIVKLEKDVQNLIQNNPGVF